jgi:three-Cys-motif partner protein
MPKFSPIVYVKDDGLITPKIGDWGLRKYNLMGAYCNIFTSAMKGRWDRLVYIDLFAGAGHAYLRGIEKIVHTSPLIALNTPYPFTDYFFSEYESEKIDALKDRVERNFPDRNVTYYQGDSNVNVSKICEQLAYLKQRYKTLCFCFVDPFSLNLHFETIRQLSAFQVDFLILLAINMDYQRNLGIYLEDENEKVELFLGNPDWRSELRMSPDKQNIMNFLALQYDKNMVSLNYKTPPDKHRITTGQNNIALYHLAFYSRHDLGNDFFNKIRHHGQGMQLSAF